MPYINFIERGVKVNILSFQTNKKEQKTKKHEIKKT